METEKANAFEKYIKEKQLTKKEFCKTCKICVATLNKISNNDDTVRIFPILKIIDATKLQLEDFFEPTRKEEGKE